MEYKHKFNLDSYQKLLNEIFQRFPSVQTSTFKDAYKPGLGGMSKFDEILGHPHKNYPIIHVAGTNGKGSVANMISAMLTSMGLKVGLYTSPHILDFRERMRVSDNGKTQLVEAEYVNDFILDHKKDFEEIGLSFFEITTSMAFQWFSDMNVDVAVIEVGLGGRLDSTNIITPVLSVITSIGLDHCDLLGDTLAKVASEKAGIIKKNVPVVIGETNVETRPVFIKKAGEMSSEIVFADKDEAMLAEIIDNKELEHIYENMDLRGSYQRKNVVTSLVALEMLRKSGAPIKMNFDSKIYDALIHTAKIMGFHGRWEKLCDKPYVICDIGHNAHALKNNFAQLSALLDSKEYSSLIIIYGIMADKNLDDILPYFPKNATYIFTQPQTKRALASELLMSEFSDYKNRSKKSYGKFFATSNVPEAVKLALHLTQGLGEKPFIYIGGSNFVVSEALPEFIRLKE